MRLRTIVFGAILAGSFLAAYRSDLPENILSQLRSARQEAEQMWGDHVAYVSRHQHIINYNDDEKSYNVFYGLENAEEGDVYYAHFDANSIVVTARPSKTAEVLWAYSEDWMLAREIGLTFKIVIID